MYKHYTGKYVFSILKCFIFVTESQNLRLLFLALRVPVLGQHNLTAVCPAHSL